LRGRRRLAHNAPIKASGLGIERQDERVFRENGVRIGQGIGAPQRQRDNTALVQRVPLLSLLGVYVIDLVLARERLERNHFGQDPVLLVVLVVWRNGLRVVQVQCVVDTVAAFDQGGYLVAWFTYILIVRRDIATSIKRQATKSEYENSYLTLVEINVITGGAN